MSQLIELELERKYLKQGLLCFTIVVRVAKVKDYRQKTRVTLPTVEHAI